MVQQTSRGNLNKYSSGETGWTHSDTVDRVANVAPVAVLDTGTFTLSGGSSPAANQTITNVSTSQGIAIRDPVVGVDSDPSFNADYAFNWDYSVKWDDANSRWDVTITVNWDTDPGSGNDVSVYYRIYEE